jgi:ubiquinol-cytochrome c reductase cytochrome c subunit
MKRGVSLLVLVLSLLWAGSASAIPPQQGVRRPPRPPGATLAQWGAELYAANCAACHGSRGEGLKPGGKLQSGLLIGAGPSLRGVGALAADFYLRTGYMPLHSAFDQPRRSHVLFSDPQIRALVAYVASLGKGPAIPKPQPDRGNLADGQQLFTEHCAGCHQVVAEGGYVTGAVAPPLEDATSTQVAEAVRIGPYLMPRFSAKQISDRQLDSIVRYVQYAKHPDDRGGWAIGHLGPVPEGLVTWLIAAVVLVAVCVLIGERLRSE